MIYLGVVGSSLARAAGAGAIAGAAIGVVLPAVVLYAIQVAMYFFAGFFSAMSGADLGSPPARPRWLFVAFVFGAVYLLALSIL
jgi:hypothetical protein